MFYLVVSFVKRRQSQNSLIFLIAFYSENSKEDEKLQTEKYNSKVNINSNIKEDLKLFT